ncbi:MAG TPA: ATP-binding cassette domain-containing protein [Mariprofundaceae bacterium]|nr:ATP-binding cassette domain-containing protein [Mariprofundaceae bacterium]
MIKTKGLTKTYGNVAALNDINLHIKGGEVTVILGGSGSGKTTLLRLLAGLESPTSGSIMFSGEDLAKISRKRLYELRLRVGMLFQYSALLNSLTVYENVAFPLREHTDLDKEVIHTMVTMKLEQVGLRGFEEMMPSQLSGGMAKRVAFARALAMDPQVVFFDEPTSGLDPISAGVISSLIHETTVKTRMTSVVVTHDVQAGLDIADHVILLWQGEIIAEGKSNTIKNSDDPRVQQFIEGRPNGPIPFSRSQTAYVDDLTHKPGCVRLE